MGRDRQSSWQNPLAAALLLALALGVGAAGRLGYLAAGVGSLIVGSLSATLLLLFQRRARAAEATLAAAERSLEVRLEAQTRELAARNEALQHEAAERAASESQLRTILDSASDAIVTTDDQGRIIAWNRGATHVFGYAAAEILGHSVLELVPVRERLAREARERTLRAMDRNTPLMGKTSEMRALKKDGTEFEAEVSLASGRSGAQLFFTRIIRDVSDRKKAEAEAREATALWRAILDSANASVISTDPSGIVREYNSTAQRWLGYSRAEVVGKPVPPSLQDPKEIRARAEELSRELGRLIKPGYDVFTAKANLGIPDEHEWTYIRKDGSRFPVHLSVTALMDPQGAITGYVGVATDLTERKRAEAELHQLKEAMENAVEGISRCDAEGRYLVVNAAYAAALGHSPASLIGRPWNETVHSDDRAAMRTALDRLRRENKVEVEARALRTDGTWFHSRQTLIASRRPDGSLLGHYRFSKDITESKRAEQELIRAKEAAEAAMRARADFLARMSHEIRTPMNGVLGMTDLALQTNLTPEQREYLRTVRDSAGRLLEIINDILDFSKIDAGRLRLEQIGFHLRDTLGSALRGLALRAHAKGLELVLDVPPDIPDRLVGDPQRLQQVIVNLVGNAIKFTEAGEVAVTVEQRAATDDSVELSFRVTDTGIGIPKEIQSLIFEAFTQADEATTRKFGGTGLGLAISAQLVGLMGGKITVQSRVGVGSSFEFSVGFAHDAAQPSLKAAMPALAGTRVLVVDEHPHGRDILVELLRGWRLEAITTSAAEVRIKGAANLGVDIQLVLLDGLSATEELLERLAASTSAPIILLTRTGDAAQLSPFVAAHVSKPIIASALLETIQRVLKGGPKSIAPVAPPRPAARRLKLLLAEDNPVNQRVAKLMLEREGHSVTAVENGRQALTAIETGSFDLVLMDIQMPELDGLSAIRMLRAHEVKTGGHLPVVALTAQAMRGDREKCLEAGADGYVTKPFVLALLQEEMDRVLDTRPMTPPPPPDAMPAIAPSGPALNEAWLRDNLGDDDELLREILDLFIQTTPPIMTALRDAVARQVAADVQTHAHKLKGALLNLAAEAAAAAALKLELDGREGDLSQTPLHLATLEEEVKRALEASAAIAARR